MWKSGIPLYILCFLHCFLCEYAVAKDGLIPNGDFNEAPPIWARVANVLIVPNVLPKWESDGLIEYIENLTPVLPKERRAVRLGSDGKISQRIKDLKKESLYSLTFSAAGSCYGPAETLNVTVVPYEPRLVSLQTSLDTYAFSFTALDYTHDLIFRNPVRVNDTFCGPIIYGVAIKEVSKKYENENLLWNGDFEEGPTDFLNGTNGILLFQDHNNNSLDSPLPGWTIESVKPAKYIDSAHFRVPQGSMAVELLESVFSQTRYTKPGSELRLSFCVGDAGNGCKGSMVVEVFGGEERFKVLYESKGTGGFKTAAFKFVNHAETTRVAFRSSFIGKDNSGSLCGPVVDDVKLVTVVP